MEENPSNSDSPPTRWRLIWGRMIPPLVLLLGMLLCLVALFVVLDLAGRTFPVFETLKWGTFSEWALAVLTPLMVVVSVATWAQDREDRRVVLDEQRQREAIEEARAAESALQGLALVKMQGVGGPVLCVRNDCDWPVTVLGTASGPLAESVTIEPRGFCPLEGVGSGESIYGRAGKRRFTLTEEGVRLDAE